MLTEERIYDAYNNRAQAIEEVAECVEQIAQLKEARLRQLAEKVAAGLYAECKNEDQRKAAAGVAMAEIDARIAAWEKRKRQADLAYDLASNDTGMIAALLRLRDSETI